MREQHRNPDTQKITQHEQKRMLREGERLGLGDHKGHIPEKKSKGVCCAQNPL
jgi:hypothetical protein